jgi:hypothetical protein
MEPITVTVDLTEPEEGDIFDGAGNFVGTIYLEDRQYVTETVRALEIEILLDGKWYTYKLDSIDDKE